MRVFLKLVTLAVFIFTGHGALSQNDQPNTDDEYYDQVFVFAEKMPVFSLGDSALLSYLKTNLKYPQGYENVTGTVYATFVVSKTGEVRDARIIKTINGAPESFNTEVLRLINSMPKWEPGKMKGRPVAVQYTVPVRFQKP